LVDAETAASHGVGIVLISDSAEYWERTGLSMDPELSLQRPILEPSRPSKPVTQEVLARQRRPEPAWKPLYPEVIEPSLRLLSKRRKAFHPRHHDKIQSKIPFSRSMSSDPMAEFMNPGLL
jgi:hypothetical protein